MKARFNTSCSICGGRIREGDEITNDDGEWVHASCDDALPETANKLCTDCYLYHAGPCS